MVEQYVIKITHYEMHFDMLFSDTAFVNKQVAHIGWRNITGFSGGSAHKRSENNYATCG
jgi:hypothetical protein